MSSTIYLHFADGKTELELSRLHYVFFRGMTRVSRPRNVEAPVLLTTALTSFHKKHKDIMIVEDLVQEDTRNK